MCSHLQGFSVTLQITQIAVMQVLALAYTDVTYLRG